jgi:uncharacterized membrane protein YiaA
MRNKFKDIILSIALISILAILISAIFAIIGLINVTVSNSIMFIFLIIFCFSMLAMSIYEYVEAKIGGSENNEQ